MFFYFIKVFFLHSLVLYSLVFFFFRTIDFVAFLWTYKIWPPFVDVDTGEFFNLFDTYTVGERPSTAVFLPSAEDWGSAVFYQDNLVACSPGTTVVYAGHDDTHLHDLPGVGGLAADMVEPRDMETDEGYRSF
jgi:hypothetical protein